MNELGLNPYQENLRPKKLKVATALITDEENRILLIKRAREPFKGHWALISGVGASIKGLPPRKGVPKEVYGDLGVEIEKPSLIISIPVTTEPDVDENVAFRCKLKPGQTMRLNPKFVEDIQWVSPHDMMLRNLPFEQNQIVEAHLRKQAKITKKINP